MRPQSKVFTSAEETLHRLTVLKRHELLHRTEQGTRAAQSRAQMHLRPVRADLASNCNRNKPVAPNSHKTSEIKEQTNHTRCQFALTNTSRCDSKQLINIAVRKLNIRTSANSGARATERKRGDPSDCVCVYGGLGYWGWEGRGSKSRRPSAMHTAATRGYLKRPTIVTGQEEETTRPR